MFDIFAAVPEEVRRDRLVAYREYLRERDGTIDVQRKTLSRREERMARLEQPSMPAREIQRDLFAELYAKFDRKRQVPAELMLLLALTKVNAAEAYGVSIAFGAALKSALAHGDDTELNLLIEETYHTRILLSSARLYGMTVEQPYTPPSALRILVNSVIYTPELFARPITLCGEIMGVLFFYRLLGVVERVLKHDPELRDAIQERVAEVLVDEIGHISFNRMHMTAGDFARTRMLLPLVERGLANVIPELRVLGAMPDDARTEIGVFAKPGGFPDFVRREAFFA